MNLPQVRSRWMWTVLAVVVALTVVALLVDARRDDDPEPGPTASASASSVQRTLLIQARNDDELGVDNVIFGVGGGLSTAELLVPSRLVVEPVGSGPETLADTARALNRSTSQTVLGELFAARIDTTLSLGRLALAGMVDFVGGIDVQVNTAITSVDPQTGQRVVVVAAGQQHLAGTQAAAYALAWPTGEPETARLERYSQVMTRTIAALPDDQLRIEQMLSSLGGSARTTSSRTQVASMLLALRPALAADSQVSGVLPTVGGTEPTVTASPSPTQTEPATPAETATSNATPAETATPTASPTATAAATPPNVAGAEPGLRLVRIRLPEASRLVSRLLSGALLDPQDVRPRVLVRDGVGMAGVSTQARLRISDAGMVSIEGGATEPLGRTETRIDVGSGADSAELGERIADALGLPDTAVRPDQNVVEGSEATVVLGSDFE